ncbi:MAG: tetratricopeptide repeat protein, partial [Blastocatellia bacterium]
SWTLAHLGLAAAYYKDGKFPEAVQQYQLATQLDPKSSIAFAGLGAARAASGETEQGMKDLLAAIELDPNNAFPHYTLGLIYSKSKKKKDRNLAVDEFTRAIELNKTGGDFKNDDAARMISELKGHHKR